MKTKILILSFIGGFYLAWLLNLESYLRTGCLAMSTEKPWIPCGEGARNTLMLLFLVNVVISVSVVPDLFRKKK